MKRIFALLFISTIFLIGCNSNSPNKESMDTSNNQNTTNQINSNNSGEEEIIFDEEYKANSWDDNLKRVIAYIAGEENKDIVPSVNATSYAYGLTIDEQTKYELAIIKCYGINTNNVVSEYENALIKNKYNLSSELPYGFIELNVTDDLVVQYEIKESTEAYLELLVYKVTTRIASWPEKEINTYIGESIPKVDAVSYEVMQDLTIDYNVRLTIYAYHVNYKSVSEYEKYLTENGFTIVDSLNYKEAIRGTIHIMYNLYEDTLTLYITNDWPYAYIYSILGQDLPKLEDDNVTFDYSFVPIENNQEVLTLYYDNATLDNYNEYGELLVSAGFTLDGKEEVQKSNDYTYHFKDYIVGEVGNEEHYISLMYCEEKKTIAIAIYF